MEVDKLRIRIITLIVSLACSCAYSAAGRDIAVPGDAATLNEALKLAGRDDRIVLAPGQYSSPGLDLVDGVTILGDPDDPGSVVLHAQGEDRVLRAESIALARIIGVTITGGYSQGSTSYAGSGGGLFVSNSRVELEFVSFHHNSAASAGGCIRASDSFLVVEDCSFVNGAAIKGGGAIDLSYGSQAEIRRTVFRNNRAAWGGAISVRTGSSCWINDSFFTDNTAVTPQELGGAFFADYAAQVAFNGCVFSGNAARQGGAARLGDALTSFVGCTLVGNAAWEAGGAFMVRRGALHVDHSIVAFNEGDALTMEESLLNVTVTDIYGNLGGDWTGDLETWRDQENNLETDPLFCDDLDLHLQDTSPCAEANSPLGLIGALPAGCTQVGILLQEFQAVIHFNQVILTWAVDGGSEYEFQLRGHAVSDDGMTVWDVPYQADDEPGSYRAVDKPEAGTAQLEYTLDARLPGGVWFFLGILQIAYTTVPAPDNLTVGKIFPNPFNPQVTIQFSLASDTVVEAAIFDLQGRLVRGLTHGALRAGPHVLSWDSRGDDGRMQSTGTYLLRIMSAGSQYTSKLLLVK